MKQWLIEFRFVSPVSGQADYFRRMQVSAQNAEAALTIAGLQGFSWFGASFTENCIDWYLVH